MQDGEWYFDSEDSTVSTTSGDLELEVCKVANFDLHESKGIYGGKYYFGEKSKAHAALLTSAPALLKALEDAKSKIECSQRAHERASVILVDEALEIIDSAIAAARGEA